MTESIRTSGQLGPVVKRLRKNKGWSQATLGKKIGLSQERISAIEAHPERCSVDQLLTLLMVLDAELQIESRSSFSTRLTAESPATETYSTKPKESW